LNTDPTTSRLISPALLLLAAWLLLPGAIVYCQSHLDRRIADWLATTQGLSWPLLGWPHRLADVLVAVLPLMVLLCAHQLWRRRTPPWLGCAIDGSASLALVLALKTPIKALFGRTWPTTFFEGNPSYLEHGVYGFQPLSWQVAYWAFPSGHAAEITAVAVAAAWYYPRAAWWMLLLSLVVMADLVLLNYHWLSDVIGGALFGLTAALLVRRLQLPQRLQPRFSRVSD